MIKILSTFFFACAGIMSMLLFCSESSSENSADCSSKLVRELAELAENKIRLEKGIETLEVMSSSGIKNSFVEFQQFKNNNPHLNDLPDFSKIRVKLENDISNLSTEVLKMKNTPLDELPDLSKLTSCRDSLAAIRKFNETYVDRLEENEGIFKWYKDLKQDAGGFIANFTPAGSSENNSGIVDPMAKGDEGRMPPSSSTLKSGFGTSEDLDQTYDYYIVDPKKEEVHIANWSDGKRPLQSIANVDRYFKEVNRTPHLIMNGGMYDQNLSAKGLFVAGGKEYKPLDVTNGDPRVMQNFYLMPNGVYYVDKFGQGSVMETQEFDQSRPRDIVVATQSGPMLLINGKIHPRFNEPSPNVNIRNGVGILPDGRTIYAITNRPVNFYAFATFFKELGCENALYLDGVVSRMYEPEKRRENGNNLGVFIVVTEKK